MNRTYARGVTLVAVALLIVGCGGGSTSSGVPWNDYEPALRGKIDTLEQQKDCVKLQTLFDNADANNSTTMSRTGHNNAALMGYLDDAMKDADCY